MKITDYKRVFKIRKINKYLYKKLGKLKKIKRIRNDYSMFNSKNNIY